MLKVRLVRNTVIRNITQLIYYILQFLPIYVYLHDFFRIALCFTHIFLNMLHIKLKFTPGKKSLNSEISLF